MVGSTGHFNGRILFVLCIFFSVAFAMGICAPANAGPTPAYAAHPAITNISPQNTDSKVVSPITHTGSFSDAKPITFTTDPVTRRSYVSDHIIVRFKSRNDGSLSVSNDKIQMAHAKVGATVLKDFSAGGLAGMQLVQLNGTDVQTAIKEYQSDPDVLYAEPDYEISITRDETGPAVQSTGPLQIASIPNDPDFSYQWALHNTGQTDQGTPGTPGADINATAAWGISTGSNAVIVAVIDTGVNYTLPDLSPNIWTNPADGSHGWNFIAGNNNPLDDNGHGTDCAGILGAVGNNGIGIAGVNWHVQVMALKAFDASGSGFDSNSISAIQYADAHGASVISNSWGGFDFDPAMKDAIAASPAVVVSAAGNNATDNDNIPFYPASYPSANIISVAATDQNDNLASFSDNGPTSVHLAAPGQSILGYGEYGEESYWSGTSMATPFVSGVAALVKSINPNLTNVQIKNIILNNVDVLPSLSGKVSTGGRLDAYKAVRAAANTLVPPTVTSISPAAGPIAGSTVVTITGTSLTGATAVSFGGAAATHVMVVNTTAVNATTPTHVAGTVDVTATTLGGTSATSAADQYTYEGPPTVTKLSLTTGPLGGGSPVTITGTGFIGATNVYFGGIPAPSYIVNNATSITATTPGNGAGTVDVTVTTTPGGTSAVNPPNDYFTYEGPPTVTKLNPNTGPAGGGTVVTITGINLLGATNVYFGGTPAASYNVTSATSITAKSPAEQSGPVDPVTVITPSGTSAIIPTDQFTYTGSTQASIAVTRSMPATVAPGASIIVTLTPGTTFATSPGWGVTETLPANWTFVSSTADNQSVVGGAYQFAELSAIPITYTVTAPATRGAYTFNGTYIDGNKDTGTVVGAVSVAVVPNPLQTYDTNHDGLIQKSEAVAAVTDYLFNNTLSKADCVTVVTAYLFNYQVYWPPTVTDILPNTGTTAGGTSVTITGYGFSNVTGVDFGAGNLGTIVGSPTFNSITVTSPAGTGTVDVTVITASGTSVTSPADQFTYV